MRLSAQLRRKAWLILPFIGLIACKNHSAPYIKSDAVDSIYNFGHITKPDTLKHTFYIKNAGNVDMQISNVASSCDCMTLNWQKTPIPPGEKGAISVAVSPNMDVKGKGVKYFMVRTNAQNPISVYKVFFDK